MLEDGVKRVKIMGEDVDVAATIQKLDDYSGHADGPELVQWLKERLPITGSVFLTHGEEEPQIAFAENIRGKIIKDDCIIRPRLDDVYDISSKSCALLASETKPRIDPAAVAKLDWNNDLNGLMLDIETQLKNTADAKGKAAVVRKLRRALAEPQGAADE